MKNILRYTLPLFSAVAMLVTACEKDATPHGKAPESIGSISVDRTRIGGGQPVTATITLPQGGENIESVGYTWLGNDGISHAGVEADGKSTYKFTAPTTAGTYELKFNARYIFKGPDAEGNAYKDLSTTFGYSVVRCDAHTSFWGDTVEETLVNRPGLQKKDDSTYEGLFPDTFSASTLNPPLIPYIYTFAEGKLTRIAEMESLTTPLATADLYIRRYLSQRSHIMTLLAAQTPVSEVVTWTDGQPDEAFNPSGDNAYQDRIGTGIMNHTAEITSIFRGTQTDIRLEVFSATDGSAINYMRTYQKVSTM